MPLDVLLLGPQGAGKGTQAKRAAAEYDIPHVSTGDMFRAAIAAETELGKRVKSILDAGELVPDELTVALVRERLSREDARNGFILDGFPRNLTQAAALDAMLEEIGRDLAIVLELRLDDETAMERLLGRAREENRPDDTPEVVRRRLEIYHRETEPLVDYYLASGKVVGIHGDRSVDEVFAEIQDALELAKASA